MADALLGGLIINEIHPQPVAPGGGYDTDQSGTVTPTDEFIEFFNSSDAALDISGLQLWDPGEGNWFTFPPGSVLGAGEYAVVITNVSSGGTLPDADLAFSANRPGALINNGGDNIILLDPGSSQFIVAAFGNWNVIDPRNPVGGSGSVSGLAGFPQGTTQSGAGENFGAVVPGQSISRVPNGSDNFDREVAPTPGSVNLCFVSGAMIDTPSGPRAVETLAAGDAVLTQDGQARTIVWVGLTRIRAAAVRDDPRMWPIRFAPGALGLNCPTRELGLSPQHRILVSGAIAARMFGASSVLVPAKDFLSLPGVSQPRPVTGFWYAHIMCDAHHVVRANGVATETLYLGEMTRDALPPDALREILQLFPDLSGHIQPALLFAKGKRARKLIARHLAHDRPIQQDFSGGEHGSPPGFFPKTE